MSEESVYIAIDLKSFYASVECVERGLDPLRAHLVVADGERTDKTICLAVSPSLKALGVSSRPRLFEVIAKVREINAGRRRENRWQPFSHIAYDSVDLASSPSAELGYITAVPRMGLYMKYSTDIYKVYLKYIAPEDIHVYSIDEVFIHATPYLKTYGLTARELTVKIIRDVLATTGITATAGIGTNMYLCKVAMDIVAKKIPADRDGVRIAELDEMSYRRLLWEHKPLTDFWRVGAGYRKKLESHGMFTMGDIAVTSVYNERLLYRMFGINAELLIDHAWGYEPCTMEDIKAYRPSANSITTGQVLSCPYEYEKARLIVREMCDLLALDLVEKGLATARLTLTVGYDCESLKTGDYSGEVCLDYLGRLIPKHAHGTANLKRYSSSCEEITDAVLSIFERTVDRALLVRRVGIAACDVKPEGERYKKADCEQLDWFTDYSARADLEAKENEKYAREHRRQQVAVALKKRFGKNAIIKGMNLEEGGTTVARNKQIGGHRA